LAQHGIKVTILGCGSSGGVPRIGNHWGTCDPAEPKNRRTRCSILVQYGHGPQTTNILVDTSADMREQLIPTQIKHLDAVLFTHDHADQTHGIDDLRQFALMMGRRVDVHGDHETMGSLGLRFGYCFSTPEGSNYPPILNGHLIDRPYRSFAINGPGGALTVTPFDQFHGETRSLGFRFGSLAYSSDVVGFPPESHAALRDLDVWIVDALRMRPHPSHAHLAMTLEWIARFKPRHAILTDMHVDLDYQTLKRELPDGIEPAYDQMVVEI